MGRSTFEACGLFGGRRRTTRPVMRDRPGISDVLAIVEQLHELAGRLPELGEGGALLDAALKCYLQPHGRGTLDDALGLTPASGAEHWRTVARRQLRDQAILALACYFPGLPRSRCACEVWKLLD